MISPDNESGICNSDMNNNEIHHNLDKKYIEVLCEKNFEKLCTKLIRALVAKKQCIIFVMSYSRFRSVFLQMFDKF